jgi:hypothetical protein
MRAGAVLIFWISPAIEAILPELLATIVATGIARLCDSIYSASLRRGVKLSTAADLPACGG